MNSVINKVSRKLSVFSILFLTHVAALGQESVSTTGSITSISPSSLFARDRWGVSYMSYINGPAFEESSGGSINHYLTLKHKFTLDWGLSFTARPDSNFNNTEPAYSMSDPYFKLSYPAFYKNENGFKITGDVLYYIPASEKSKMENSNGAFAPRLITSFDEGNLSFLYLLIPKFYFNKSVTDGQKTLALSHYFSSSYKINQLLSIDLAVNPSWTYKKNQGTDYGVSAYPGLTLNLNKELSFSPYIELSAIKPERKTSSFGGVLNYTLL